MDKRMKGSMGLKWRIENDPAKRKEAILNNIPIRFEIEEAIDPSYKMSFWDNLYNVDTYGRSAVQKHDDFISKHSEKHNIDPDMLRAVMYAENARGHKIIVNDLTDQFGKSKSIMPMNIQKDSWSKLIDKNPEDMYDPNINVEASTILLRRITNALDKPTPAKVGTLWNNLGARKTNKFGHYIGNLYQEKSWRTID